MKFGSDIKRKTQQGSVVLLCVVVSLSLAFANWNSNWQRAQHNSLNCSVAPGSATQICCCATASSQCKCVECDCRQNDMPAPPQPALPPSEQIEFVFALGLGIDIERSMPDCESRKPVRRGDQSAISSAQETCAFLSRFRC